MKNLRKKLFGSMLTVALMIALVMGAVPAPGVVITARASEVPEPQETYNSENVWVGTLELNTNKVVGLSDINVTNSIGSAIRITGNATVHLVISGSVQLTGGADSPAAGIEVEEGSTLHLYGTEGSNLTVKGGRNGAGIGGVGDNSNTGENHKAGAIVIHSGTIVAEGGFNSAGIGSGNHQSASEIKIYGGSVTATGSFGGAGIGSGYGSSGAPGAMNGVGYHNGGNITISGGTVSATGGEFAAGIGGGYGASSGNIVIDGEADVTATGDMGGAGIGTGRGTPKESYYDTNSSNLSVTIGGNARVTAIALEDTRVSINPASGAAIGLGRGWNPCGMISIEGNATVSAEAKKYAAAIGGSLRVKSVSADSVPTLSDMAAPSISIAPTAGVSAQNDGTVYAVNGDQMHSMSWPVTFTVVNGAWNDGNDESITVSAKGYEGEGYDVKLTAEQIPAVGARPKDTYRAGNWDVTPSADTAITAATTYTYTYAVKEIAVAAEAPKAKTLTYTGAAQELVTAGSATGGEMHYAVTVENIAPAESIYSSSIPKKTDAGTYYVWYKVVGDENHFDSKPVSIIVTIEEDQKVADTSIETEVKTSDGAPIVKVANLNDELALKLLTDEEKAEYEAGTPVLVYLDVTALDKADVPAIDIAAIEKVIHVDGYTYGECLDISLWKKLGKGTPTQIHDTNGNPIKITVTIPDTLKSVPTGYTRTYHIIRVHDGVATVMAEGIGATLEISSDKFSSYFLVYKDTKVESVTTTETTTAASTSDATTSDATTASATTEAAKTSPKTGDSMPIAVVIAFMLSAAGMLVFLDWKKKKTRMDM